MNRTRISACLLLSLLAACAGSPAAPPVTVDSMSVDLVTAHGTRAFRSDPGHTFDAASGALKALGYEIAFASKETGVIKTTPKTIRSDTAAEAHTEGAAVGGMYSGSTTAGSSSVTYTRSYALKLTEAQSGTVVQATPSLFANGADISTQKIWELDGPMGEYALWDRLFAEIGSNLGEK